MTATEILHLLNQKANQRGVALYEAVGLVNRLLADRPWVEAPDGGGGDEARALDRLEAKYFASECGPDLSLSQLLDVYRHYPDATKWSEHHFNVRKMYALYKAATAPKKPAPAPRPVPQGLPAPIEFSQLPPATAKHAYERATRMVEKEHREVERLRERCAELEAENKMLRDRVRDLETELARRAPQRGAAG